MFRFNLEFGFVQEPTAVINQGAKDGQPVYYEPKRWDVYLVDLPQQSVTQRSERGKPFSVTGTELHGHHRLVVLRVDDDGRFVIGIPMTSAVDSRGGEKWQAWKKSWHRAIHEGKAVCIQVEQVRYVDRTRLMKPEESSLSEYDQRHIEEKLRALLSL